MPRSVTGRLDSRRRLTVAGKAVALGVASGIVVGCFGGGPLATPEAEGSLASTPATTPTEAPPPTLTPAERRSPPGAPPRPRVSDNLTDEDAIAIAKYFIELYEYVYNTGDLAEWRSLSHPDCKFCQSVVEGVTETHGAGRHVEGAGVIWHDDVPAVVDYGAGLEVRLLADQEAAKTLASSGDVVNSTTGSTATLLVFVEDSDQGPVIRGVEVQPEDATR